jgi:ABC-2 type transport system ATP-binding protein
MNDASISIRGLSKSFPADGLLGSLRSQGSLVPVLRGIDLDVPAGQIFGLLGPNGAGKTTLLEILATLLLPSGGEARICGRDVVAQADDVRGRIGYCPAASESFYPRLSSVENLEFFAVLQDLSAERARERITAVLELMQLNGARAVAFQKLSQGMKQRLGLARALLSDPPVLLLDEPFRSLDPLHQIEMQRLLRRIAEEMGKTILVVTHSLAEAEAVCHRIGILHRGRLLREGPVQEIKQVLREPDLAAAFAKALEERQ